MDHIIVFEATHDLQNGIDLTNVAEEFIAQPFAFAGTFDDAGDIDQFQSRWNNVLGNDVFGDSFEPSVGNTDHAFVGLDRAKRIVFTGSRFGKRQRIEQRTFANIW